MIIPISERPFPKKEIASVLSRTKISWGMVSIVLPLLSFFTLYLFDTYTEYNSSSYIYLLILFQIIYSLFLLQSLFTEGIRVDSAILKKYKDKDLIFFTKVVNKTQLNSYYLGIGLYFIFIVFLFFATW